MWFYLVDSFMLIPQGSWWVLTICLSYYLGCCIEELGTFIVEVDDNICVEKYFHTCLSSNIAVKSAL